MVKVVAQSLSICEVLRRGTVTPTWSERIDPEAFCEVDSERAGTKEGRFEFLTSSQVRW